MEIKRNRGGNVVISDAVIEKIATSVAKDINGVADVVARKQDVRSIIKTQRLSKAVSVVTNDNKLEINMNIKTVVGVKLADIALEVQQSVKDAVQNMTSCVVSKVNVNIVEVELNAEASN